MSVELRQVTEDEAEMRLDKFLLRHRPGTPFSVIQKILRTGQVRVDGGRAKPSTRLSVGQTVRIPPIAEKPRGAGEETGTRPRAERAAPSGRHGRDLRALILYEDADVIALNKPAGIAVQGGTKQTDHVDAWLDELADGGERPRLVHRLDKDTAGVLLVARTSLAAQRLTRLFRERDARKEYWAVTVGAPHPDKGDIRAALTKAGGAGRERMQIDEVSGKKARSLYVTVEHAGKRAAWLALWPLTGRTHQLRVHLAAIDTPILGDGKYGGAAAKLPGVELPRGLYLHARRLQMPHPIKGEIDVTAPLPEHMRAAWDYFGFAPRPDGDPLGDFARLMAVS